MSRKRAVPELPKWSGAATEPAIGALRSTAEPTSSAVLYTGDHFTGTFANTQAAGRDDSPTSQGVAVGASRHVARGNTTSRAETRIRLVLLSLGFVETTGLMLAVLLVPEHARTFGASDTVIGTLAALFPGAQMVSAMAWGAVSDRLGRRPVLLAGLWLSAASWVVLALAPTLWMVALSRVLHGVGTGTSGVVMAALADRTHASDRARVLGYLTAATSLGAVAAPLLFWLMRALTAPMGQGSTIGAASHGVAVVTLCLVVGTARTLQRDSARVPRLTADEASAEAPRVASLAVVLVAVYALAVSAASGVPTMLPVIRHGHTGPDAAHAILLLGSVGVLIRAFAVGPLVARIGERPLLTLGLLHIGAALMLLGVSASAWSVIVAMVVLATGTALTFPALGALLTFATPPARHGLMLGLQQAAGGATRALLPVGLGVASDNAQLPVLLLAGSSALFATAMFIDRRLHRVTEATAERWRWSRQTAVRWRATLGSAVPAPDATRHHTV